MAEQKNQIKILSLRLPAELHAELVQIATGRQRSLNSQILFFLKRGVKQTSKK
jgi:hypothetical protein